MAERPAINASPLILLSRVGKLFLLKSVSEEIVVPAAVATEIQQYGAMDVTVEALAQTDWLVVVENPPVPEPIQSRNLGAGESAVLAWGYIYHPDTEVIVDDLAARRCAAALGIPVRGTLGLVLTAKQNGTIPAARPILEQLRQSGLYLSDRVMNQTLAVVAE